jgi:hypothetical protein
VIRRLDGRRGIPGKAEQAETFGPGLIDTAGRDPLWPMVRRAGVFLARNGPVSDASSIMPRARRCLSFAHDAGSAARVPDCAVRGPSAM